MPETHSQGGLDKAIVVSALQMQKLGFTEVATGPLLISGVSLDSPVPTTASLCSESAPLKLVEKAQVVYGQQRADSGF